RADLRARRLRAGRDPQPLEAAAASAEADLPAGHPQFACRFLPVRPLGGDAPWPHRRDRRRRAAAQRLPHPALIAPAPGAEPRLFRLMLPADARAAHFLRHLGERKARSSASSRLPLPPSIAGGGSPLGETEACPWALTREGGGRPYHP